LTYILGSLMKAIEILTIFLKSLHSYTRNIVSNIRVGILLFVLK